MRVEFTHPAQNRFPAIDELKGLAIIIVVLSHARSVLPLLAETLRGEVGVDIFLALSGFLLAFSSTNESTRDFLRKKAWRILPTYWLALVFFATAKAVTIGSAQIESLGLHLFALHLFASPQYIYDINRSFWFVPLIVFAYLVFLAVRNRIERTGLMIALCGALTVMATLWYQHVGYPDGIMNIAPRFLPLFLGMIAGRAYRNGSLEIKPGASILCGITLIAVTMFMGVPYTDSIIGALIISAWLLLRKFFGRAKGALAFLGVISYEIFLFHQPLIDEFNIFTQKELIGIMPSQGYLTIGVLAGLALTLVISVFLHRLLEKGRKLRLESLPREGERPLS